MKMAQSNDWTIINMQLIFPKYKSVNTNYMIKNVLGRNTLLLIGIFILLIASACSVSRHSYKEHKVVVNRSNGDEDIRNQVLETAIQYIGVPYKYGGKTPGGFDCSGFTSYVMAKNGIALAPSSSLQARQGKKLNTNELRKGDLIFFENSGKINHVGIVKEAGKHGLYVIHATSSSGVRVDEIKHSPYWGKRIKYGASVVD
jgi:hypothetical protein